MQNDQAAPLGHEESPALIWNTHKVKNIELMDSLSVSGQEMMS